MYNKKSATQNLGSATQNEKCVALLATQKKCLISNAARISNYTNNSCFAYFSHARQGDIIYEFKVSIVNTYNSPHTKVL